MKGFPLFTRVLILLQCLVLLILLCFYRIMDVEEESMNNNSTNEYRIFRDILVMLLLGFGYLMTFLARYGLSAVGFTMLLTVIAMECNIILEPLFTSNSNSSTTTITIPIPLTISQLIDSEFSAATLLISFGAVIGRTSPEQLIIMAVCQSICYVFHKVILIFGLLHVEDVGGTLTIHMFGAYFGLAVSYVLGPPKCILLKSGGSESYGTTASATAVSDLFSLIGTTLLWVYWPSFVGATETANVPLEQYCIMHTVLALIGSTIGTFGMSSYVYIKQQQQDQNSNSSHGSIQYKFDPVHIANSTLAGGVAIGASARLSNVTPGGALFLGLLVGCISVIGYAYITPEYMEKYATVYDTCGVHNLHGLPSVIGGLASILFVTFHHHNNNTSNGMENDFLYHSNYTGGFFQFIGILVTIVVAIGSGLGTGYIMTRVEAECTNSSTTSTMEYDDSVWWESEYFENEMHNNHKSENGLTTTTHPTETTPLV